MQRAVWLSFLLTGLALAQGQLSQWTPSSGESRSAPKRSCSSLRELTGYDFSVTTAAEEEATQRAPKYCRVRGLVRPEVEFEVALPVDWNGRLLMVGNGGYAGNNLDTPGPVGPRDEAMRLGWVFTRTNTGHDGAREPLGTFAKDRQKLIDYAFRAVHVTAETAKRVAAAYYGSRPKRSYFQGCSTGGRQALMAAQRFPEDFDGISAGAPVLDFTGTMANYVAVQQAFAKAPVSAAKMKLAGEKIYALCDPKDGVRDGVIGDPLGCGFKPAEHLPRCTGAAAAHCFSEGEIRSLEVLYGDQTIGGKRVYPGWPVGAEAVASNGRMGWEGWLVREGGRATQSAFSESFFRYLADPRDSHPTLSIGGLDLDKTAGTNLTWIRSILDATDPDLSQLRQAGGKVLLWFGLADPALNARRAIEYYEEALKVNGAGTKDFFRFFLLPGVFHCGGGPGCDNFPHMAALIDWVERGKAPERLVATKGAAGTVTRSRPLCVYPAAAKYKGSGSTDDAASFDCVGPARQ
ncbi:MAG: tannase/feruloyl esterase family alpha/beta hydrolase [Bryobacteraceae bacterium]